MPGAEPVTGGLEGGPADVDPDRLDPGVRELGRNRLALRLALGPGAMELGADGSARLESDRPGERVREDSGARQERGGEGQGAADRRAG